MSDKARIIVADDDIENGKTLEEGLKKDGHHTRVCTDGEAAMHLVRSWAPHIVLLDVNMPKLTGIDCLKKIRAMNSSEYISVIMVTSNSSLEEIIQGLDAGADDYIVKPFRVDELRARVRANLRVKVLHDSLRRANKRLEDASTLDDLTGLKNMRFMAKKLAEELDLARKQKTHISCVMLDMDLFKQINDKHDHLFGSHVLREAGQIIQGQLRTIDVAARYGGDEFFILMAGTPLKEALEVSERIRKALEAHVFRSGNYNAKLTASFGVSGTQSPEDILMAEAKELIRSADAAMYSAKNSGRNRVETLNFIR